MTPASSSITALVTDTWLARPQFTQLSAEQIGRISFRGELPMPTLNNRINTPINKQLTQLLTSMMILTSALLSTPVHAQTVTAGTFFVADSQLPNELQMKLRLALETRCMFDVNTRFEELRTEVRTETIDQGVIDQFYTTYLVAREFNFNGTQTLTNIVVQSSWYAGSNPTPEAYAQIDDIDAAYGRCP